MLYQYCQSGLCNWPWKGFVDGMNSRDKWVINLSMENMLNPGLIFDSPNLYTILQVKKNE